MIKIEDLKVGMKVKLRDDLLVGVKYGNITFLNSMKQDRIVNIRDIKTGSDNAFFIDGEEYNYAYSTKMIDYIIEKNNNIKLRDLKIGMKVKLKKNLSPDTTYGSCLYVNGMIKDYIVTITKIGDSSFEIIEDSKFVYSPEMIDYIIDEGNI